MIKAPYNFVPLSEKVFFPDWSEAINHDIPFKDGVSGELSLKITSESPIFIRDHAQPEHFCQHQGKFYIPGSSVKGMIRNVLEIMTFSKMSFVDDNTYAVRDLKNPELYTDKFKTEKIFCGWLRKDLDDYVIEDCGHPGRISHTQIDKATGIAFARAFSDDFSDTEEEKLARYKYNMVPKEKLIGRFSYKKKNNVGQEVYEYDETSGGARGTLVFTGQPTKRKNNGKQDDGKGFEFIFFDVKNTLKVDREVFDKFKFAYFDGRTTNPKESEDWKYWKKKLSEGKKVPVFFRKAGNEVLDFGLSYLYKLPYSHGVLDGIPPLHLSIASIPDMAEGIFGFVGKYDKKSLKGRVSFSHFVTNSTGEMERKTVVLGTPRSSYYPVYVVQRKGKAYKTYMDDEFSISGWKRYPIHANQPNHENVDPGRLATSFHPLARGAIFEGKVRFHNLKKAELGALISALTFHKNEKCRHNIGLAKPYGYGRIRVEITGGKFFEDGKETTFDESIATSCLQAFEMVMCTFVPQWHRSVQIAELFTMATPQKIKFLKYMTLQEYVKEKKSGRGSLSGSDFLMRFSQIDDVEKNHADVFSECDAHIGKTLPDQEMEEKDWRVAAETKKEEALNRFIKKYQNSAHKDQAKSILGGIRRSQVKMLSKEEKEEMDLRSAYADNTLYVYRRFLEKYPASSHSNEIEKAIERLEIEEKERLLEEQAEKEWKLLEESDDKALVEKFLENCHVDTYKELARNRVELLEKKEARKREAEKRKEEAKKKHANLQKQMGKMFAGKLKNGPKKSERRKKRN